MTHSCLIIAGEKSGEEHADSFLPEILHNNKEIEFWGVGGELFRELGVTLTYHLNDFSSWGFSEVISKIPFYLKALKELEKEAIRRNTKTAILIDFQTFNLMLAKRLKKHGINVLYYVAPQAWVWKAWRAKVIEQCVHTLFTILPFEKNWFQDRGVSRVKSVKHPLVINYQKELDQYQLDCQAKPFKRFKEEIRICLLPGSRNFEVENLAIEFYESLVQLKQKFNIIVSLVRSPSVKMYNYQQLARIVDHDYTSDELAKALTAADLCLAASGTVTLACALFEVPTVVTYKSTPFNEFIYDCFVEYSGDVCLANIVHEERIFPELIQNRATSYNMIKALESWLTDATEYEKIKQKLRSTREKLSGEDFNVSQYMRDVILKAI